MYCCSRIHVFKSDRAKPLSFCFFSQNIFPTIFSHHLNSIISVPLSPCAGAFGQFCFAQSHPVCVCCPSIVSHSQQCPRLDDEPCARPTYMLLTSAQYFLLTAIAVVWTHLHLWAVQATTYSFRSISGFHSCSASTVLHLAAPIDTLFYFNYLKTCILNKWTNKFSFIFPQSVSYLFCQIC